MSEKRKESRAPELDVDALFDDPEDELESGAELANARASAALGGSTPDNSSPSNPRSQPSSPRGSAPSNPDPLPITPSPRDQLETIMDLDAEAQLPAVLAPGAPASGSRPSNLPPAIVRRSVAPPMAVPSLRPPEAHPPPMRQTFPPPERLAAVPARVSGTEPTPRAPRSLPPLAPAPTARRKPESVHAAPAPSSRTAYDAPTRELPPDLLQSVTTDAPRAAHAAPNDLGLTPGGTLLGPYGRTSTQPSASVSAQGKPQGGTSASADSSESTAVGLGVIAQPPHTEPLQFPDTTLAPDATLAPDTTLAPDATLAPDTTLAPDASLGHSSAKRGLRAWLPLVIAFVVLLIGGLLWLSAPKAPGALVVSASGPDGQAIPKLAILVDDESRCSYSPCRVTGLDTGLHVIQARAPGFTPSAPVTIEMSAATDVTHNFVLDPEVRLGGLRITARGDGLNVFVNDVPHGKPPVEVHDLTPGSYEIRVEGERFEPLSERVVLEPGERRDLGPFTPKVRRGLLTITLGANAENARVTLDGKRVGPFPTSVELDATKDHTLAARKADFHDFERDIEFTPGRALVDVEIAMLEIAEDEDDEHRSSNSHATRKATLSINSIPVSAILLDGKPIGSTPKQRVRVSPGKHSVTFVHPKRGKKTVSVKVKPGESRTVSTRF